MTQDIMILLADKKYANHINHYGLTNKEFFCLKLLSRIKEENPKFSNEERELLNDFLLSSFGNMKFNKRLRNSQLQYEAGTDTGVYYLAYKMVVDLTFRLRRVKKLNPILANAHFAYLHVINGRNPPKDSAISLGEFAILRDVAELKSTFDILDQKGMLVNNRDFQRLHEKSKRADTIMTYIENDFNRQVKLQTGTFIFKDVKKMHKVTGRTMDFFARLMTLFVTRYGHVARGLMSAKNLPMKSHIDPLYKEDKFSLREYLYSDMYVLKIEKLISEENKGFLREAYGPNWLQVVNLKYQNIERDLHDQQYSKHGHVSAAPQGRQVGIGLASLFSFKSAHYQAGATRDLLKRKKWENAADKENIKMLCSEFIAHTTIHSLQKLDREIKADLADKKIIKKEGSIVKMPIKNSERLSLMHPERLLKVLMRAKCVEKVKDMDVIHRFVRKA